MKIFIYVLTEPNGKTIRYVGKSNEFRIGKRLHEHCRYSQLHLHTHKNNWIKSLLANNQRPVLNIIEECQENNFVEREKYWVSYYKKIGCNLTNSTIGGEGAIRIHNRVISEKQKKTISKTLKQRYKEHPEMYKNCSEAGKKSRGIKRNFKFKQSSDNIGISNSNGNWRAYTYKNNRQIHIGRFKTEIDAVNARAKYLKNNPY